MMTMAARALIKLNNFMLTIHPKIRLNTLLDLVMKIQD